MRLDSPAVLSTAGSVAIHVVLAVVGYALMAGALPTPITRAPVVELIDIEPPMLKPPPPPVAAPPEVTPQTKPVEQPRIQKVTPPRAEPPPPPVDQPPPPIDTPPSGGAPVVTMEGVAPAATGVAVAVGPRSTGKIGRGGTGTGTGSGVGPGSAEAPPPVSIATIKTRAMPRGEFRNGRHDASKDYPSEAKTLGIEGVIKVRLVVDDKGRVRSTLLLNRLGHGLDELALKLAAAIEFEPARDSNDQAVSSVVVWTFEMTLPK